MVRSIGWLRVFCKTKNLSRTHRDYWILSTGFRTMSFLDILKALCDVTKIALFECKQLYFENLNEYTHATPDK